MYKKGYDMVSEPVHGCHLLDESRTFSDTDDPLSGPTFPSETINDRLNCIITGHWTWLANQFTDVIYWMNPRPFPILMIRSVDQPSLLKPSTIA